MTPEEIAAGQVMTVQVTPDGVTVRFKERGAKFDKVSYQREYMRKRRTAQKSVK